MTNYKRLEDKFCVFIDLPNIDCAEHAISDMHGYRLEGKNLLVRIREKEVGKNSRSMDFHTYNDGPVFPPRLVKINILFFHFAIKMY